MSPSNHGSRSRMERVFHPTDLSEGSAHAFAHALRLALAWRVKLTIMHVADHPDEVDWSDLPGVRSTLKRWGHLGNGDRPIDIRELGIDISKVIGSRGHPVDSVLDYLSDHHADFVVLATHQRDGRTRWTHRSIAEPIARHAHEMALFVPFGIDGFISLETGKANLANVLVPLAAHPRPQYAVNAAACLAADLECTQVTFTLVHAGTTDDMPAVTPIEREGWTWSKRADDSKPVDAILDAARDTSADLIVMATEGHHGFLDALRGSTTERVLRHAGCPLLAVPVGA